MRATLLLSAGLLTLAASPAIVTAQVVDPYGYRNPGYYGYGYGPVYGYGVYGYGYGAGYGGNWGPSVAYELKEEAEAKQDRIQAYNQSMQSAAETKLLQQKARQLSLQNQYQAKLLEQKTPQQQAQLSAEQKQMAALLAQMEKKNPPASPTATPTAPAAVPAQTQASPPATGKAASPASAKDAPAAPDIASLALKSGKPISWPDALRRPQFDSSRAHVDTLVAALRSATPANQQHLRAQLRYQIAQMNYQLQANRTAMTVPDYAAASAFLKKMSLSTW